MWHIKCLEMLAVFQTLKHFLLDLRGHHVLVRTDSTSVVSYINHQGGLCSRPLYSLPDPPLGPGETALADGSVHPWVPQSESRHPVETVAEARVMVAQHPGDGADLEEVRSSPDGLYRLYFYADLVGLLEDSPWEIPVWWDLLS